MAAAAEWVASAFPAQRGKHHLEASVLQETTLRFLFGGQRRTLACVARSLGDRILEDQNKQLGNVYSLTLDSEESVLEAIVRVNRLRNIFVDTPDQNEINDLAVQLQRITEDSAAWVADDVSPERQAELLQQQVIDQLAKLTADFDTQEIEPAWDMAPWRSQLPALGDFGSLGKLQTEILLKTLENPPDPLNPEESAGMEPVANALVAHYDQMSMNDIIARIRRLPEDRQRELIDLLTAEMA